MLSYHKKMAQNDKTFYNWPVIVDSKSERNDKFAEFCKVYCSLKLFLRMRRNQFWEHPQKLFTESPKNSSFSLLKNVMVSKVSPAHLEIVFKKISKFFLLKI